MKKFTGMIMVALLLGGCWQQKSERDENLDMFPGVVAAGEGGGLDVDIITHGDPPIWLELYERYDGDDEMDELIKALANKDTLDVHQLTYFGEVVGDMELDKVVGRFGLRTTKTRNGYTFWEGAGLGLFSDSTAAVMGMSGFDLDEMKLKGKGITQYTIKDLKEMFPKSYGLRNYYGDSYRFNFMDSPPKSYDHLVIVAGTTGKYFHFRLVDGKMVDVVIDREGT